MNLNRFVRCTSDFKGHYAEYHSVFYVGLPFEEAHTLRTFRTSDGQERASDDWLALDRCRNERSYEKKLAEFKHRLITGVYDNYVRSSY